MSVVSTDLVFYASANMPEDDSSSNGGAIDETTKVIFTDIAATDTIAGSSSLSEDDGVAITVTGRLSTGEITTDVIGITGTATQEGSGAVEFERILKAEVTTGSNHGTITISRFDGSLTEIGTMPSGVTAFRRPFYGAVANASGGDDKDLYEKIFLKNNNTTNALLDAYVIATADPSALLGFDLEDSMNDNNSTTDRTTAPAGGDMVGSPTFADTPVAVPGTNLGVGSGIGVWLYLDLNAGTAAAKTTYTLTASGSTT